MRMKSTFFFLFCFISITAFSQQENSPYSRYGLGDLTPTTNIVNRGMGGVTAAYMDTFAMTINFNNPATYSRFFSALEPRSGKQVYGRVIFDVGVNYDDHTLREPNSTRNYSSANIFFSHMQLGMPIRKHWGMSFGLRQLSRIDYKINRFERLYDPNTGNPIDSTLTEFTGDGGSYLASIGTGVAIKNFSVGVNLGYIFGKKEYITKRAFINDTVDYMTSNHTTKTTFGKVMLTGGMQYEAKLNSSTVFRLGAFGNLKQNLNGNQDVVRETFSRTLNGDIRLDSVFEQKDIKGKIVYPASYTAGIMFEKVPNENSKQFRSWMLGADFTTTKWDDYRFYELRDSVANNWQLKVGGQYRPDPTKGGFLNKVTYRAGFNVGKDYIHIGNDLPSFGASVGLGFLLVNWNKLAATQASIINVSFQYDKRGNNQNLLKDNVFRISVGFSFTDLWFRKIQYD